MQNILKLKKENLFEKNKKSLTNFKITIIIYKDLSLEGKDKFNGKI